MLYSLNRKQKAPLLGLVPHKVLKIGVASTARATKWAVPVPIVADPAMARWAAEVVNAIRSGAERVHTVRERAVEA
jgi:hypothetical protein